MENPEISFTPKFLTVLKETMNQSLKSVSQTQTNAFLFNRKKSNQRRLYS